MSRLLRASLERMRRGLDQGLSAAEAARAALEFGLAARDRIVAIVQTGNAASERVMQKIGMSLERETVDPTSGRQVRVYEITRDAQLTARQA